MSFKRKPEARHEGRARYMATKAEEVTSRVQKGCSSLSDPESVISQAAPRLPHARTDCTSTYSLGAGFGEHQAAQRTGEAAWPRPQRFPLQTQGERGRSQQPALRRGALLSCGRQVTGRWTGKPTQASPSTQTPLWRTRMFHVLVEGPLARTGLMARNISSPRCSSSPFLTDHSHSDANNRGEQS